MRLAAIVERFEAVLEQRYGHRLLPSARKALDAIKQCRTEVAPHWLAHCPQCPHSQAIAHTCGHRSCPHCQHGVGERWLAQQRERLLPVDYFLVTFTLPATLRDTAYRHQRQVYGGMLRCAWQTLSEFAANDGKISGDIGATAVLHTHNRRRDLHPHVHASPQSESPLVARAMRGRCDADRGLSDGEGVVTLRRSGAREQAEPQRAHRRPQ